jgi:hypothetical protein
MNVTAARPTGTSLANTDALPIVDDARTVWDENVASTKRRSCSELIAASPYRVCGDAKSPRRFAWSIAAALPGDPVPRASYGRSTERLHARLRSPSSR